MSRIFMISLPLLDQILQLEKQQQRKSSVVYEYCVNKTWNYASVMCILFIEQWVYYMVIQWNPFDR